MCGFFFQGEDGIRDVVPCRGLGDVYKRQGHAGRSTLSPAAAQALIHTTVKPSALGYDLTVREREVLALMVTGLNNSEIAAELGVSPSTIKSHVSHILAKFGVAGRTEAVALAVRHHVIN